MNIHSVDCIEMGAFERKKKRLSKSTILWSLGRSFICIGYSLLAIANLNHSFFHLKYQILIGLRIFMMGKSFLVPNVDYILVYLFSFGFYILWKFKWKGFLQFTLERSFTCQVSNVFFIFNLLLLYIILSLIHKFQ